MLQWLATVIQYATTLKFKSTNINNVIVELDYILKNISNTYFSYFFLFQF